LFVFEAEQKAYDVGGVTFGGQPGEYPTVLAASIFYLGDKLIIDEQGGEFDREKAYQVVESMRQTCEKAGVPLVIDMIGGSPVIMERYVEWIAPTGLPFYIDGTTAKVRLAGARKAEELGLWGRCVYNSLGPETNPKEIDALRELHPKTCIGMTHNALKPTFRGKFEIAEEVLETCHKAGFAQIMWDTAVLDLVEPGPCAKTIWLLKNKYGYPAGCSPTHMVRDRWSFGQQRFGELGYTAAKIALATSIMMMGADYFMYGIKQPEIVPAMAMVDAAIAYTMRQEKIRSSVKTHPLVTLLRLSEEEKAAEAQRKTVANLK
jgi:tetrahydromethanopterin S-methyltransferase subunit H